jgi:hypothetical protein
LYYLKTTIVQGTRQMEWEWVTQTNMATKPEQTMTMEMARAMEMEWARVTVRDMAMVKSLP